MDANSTEPRKFEAYSQRISKRRFGCNHAKNRSTIQRRLVSPQATAVLGFQFPDGPMWRDHVSLRFA
jgi:hypothetical protein